MGLVRSRARRILSIHYARGPGPAADRWEDERLGMKTQQTGTTGSGAASRRPPARGARPDAGFEPPAFEPPRLVAAGPAPVLTPLTGHATVALCEMRPSRRWDRGVGVALQRRAVRDRKSDRCSLGCRQEVKGSVLNRECRDTS